MQHFSEASGVQHQASSLSVVIPAWNEDAVIALAIDEALLALSRLGIDYELIIVDDGSTDRTAEIVRAAGKQHGRVRLVQLPANRGYGAALRAGFEAGRYELVAFTDADCQFDLSDLEQMLPLLDRYEIVSGYRIDRKDSPLRCFYSWGYNMLVRCLLGSPLRDVDCALKVFRRDALLKILPKSEQFFANTEMFTEARLQGMSINEVGVTHRPRAGGTSSVSIREIPRTLSALLPYWWQRVQFGGRSSADTSTPSAVALALLMLVAGFLLFRSLAYPLIEPDEGRYAEIAREMWRTGDWVIPRLHQEAYLDKPPLFYWLCATSFSVFGLSDWAARLVPAMAAWLTVGVTYLFGCRLFGRTSSFLGSLALALSIGFVGCGRFLILDSLLTLLVTSSLFTAHAAVTSRRFQWGWWLTSAVLCGLGVLTKGPVAFVLLAPPIIADGWLNGRQSVPRLQQWAAYIGVVALTAVPWFVAAISRMPGFAKYFFWDHNVSRYLSGSNHPEPFWFYVPALFLACMPWGLLLFPLVESLASPSPRLRRRRSPEVGFLALWAAWCVLFFSVLSGKLPTYILPCIPAIMLMIGHYVHTNCSPFAGNVSVRVKAHAVFSRGILYLAAFGMLSAGCLLLLGIDGRSETLLYGSLWTALLLAAIVTQHRVAPRVVYGVFCIAALGAIAKATHDVVPTWADQRSVLGRSSEAVADVQSWNRDLPIACISGKWGSVPFYLDRDDVTVFANHDESEVRSFVVEQGTSILVIDDDVSAKQLQALVPHDAQVKQLSTSPKATVIAVRVRQSSEPDIQLISAEAENITPVRVR